MTGEVAVSIAAVVISLASFSFAWVAARRAARAEEIKNLLGEKENVGFGALKLLRDGLPGERPTRRFGSRPIVRHRSVLRQEARQRELVIGALMAACLFESSDRARALLFRVIEKYRSTPFRRDFVRQYVEFKTTIDSMTSYKFDPKEFDPKSANLRLEAVRKVLQFEHPRDES